MNSYSIRFYVLLSLLILAQSCGLTKTRKIDGLPAEPILDDQLPEPDEIPDLAGSGVDRGDLQTLMPDGSRGQAGAQSSRKPDARGVLSDPRRWDYSEGAYGVYTLPNGIILPYPIRRILRGFGPCVRGIRKHPAIDIAGIGKHMGLGTPIRTMVREQVIAVREPEDNPRKFGRRDRRSGTVVRGRRTVPRSKVIDGYGRVYFFTRDYGTSRTGTLIITKGLSGPLKGHRIRYMHLAAVRPGLVKGEILEPGDEIGLMGGTAVLESSPHVHIDIETPAGVRVDVEALYGIERDHGPCG